MEYLFLLFNNVNGVLELYYIFLDYLFKNIDVVFQFMK